MQEAHDLALVAQAATLRSRVPFVHFFDGFRTSHELNTHRAARRRRPARARPRGARARPPRPCALPERPFVRGTAQNPDVYFQARETVNPFYARVPEIVEEAMDELRERTGRQLHVVGYSGHPEAERVVVIMGSGGETAPRRFDRSRARGERVGVVQVRLYRPFPAQALLDALPATVRAIAVLDRTKEPGSIGEPLYLDVVAALAAATTTVGRAGAAGDRRPLRPLVEGVHAGDGRRRVRRPRRSVTSPALHVGIDDDVSKTSLALRSEPRHRAIRDGACDLLRPRLGRHGRREQEHDQDPRREAGLSAQGYFVYDSKKSGSQTVSHLRFGSEAIRAPYLVQRASFVGCHQFRLLDRADVLARARRAPLFLLNCPREPDQVWDALSRPVQEQIIAKGINLYAIDAARIARAAGLPGRVNTILQTCFFALSGVLPGIGRSSRSRPSSRRRMRSEARRS